MIINTAVGIRNIPQDYRNVAAVLRLNPIEYLLAHHDPCRRALHLHRPAHRHRPVVAGHRCGRNADRRRRHRLLHLGCVELVAPARHHRGALSTSASSASSSTASSPSSAISRPAARPGRLRRENHARSRPFSRSTSIDKSFTRGGRTSSARCSPTSTLSSTRASTSRSSAIPAAANPRLLNLIAGPDAGDRWRVLLEDREVNSPGPDRAVVFQNHSLLPWLTVYDNVRLAVDKVFSGVKSRRPSGTTGRCTISISCR